MTAGGRPQIGIGSPQMFRDAGEDTPTYCAFLPNNDANFPNAYFEQTTAQPQTTPKIPSDVIDDKNRKSNFYNFITNYFN
jgi:hypothetical protein